MSKKGVKQASNCDIHNTDYVTENSFANKYIFDDIGLKIKILTDDNFSINLTKVTDGYKIIIKDTFLS